MFCKNCGSENEDNVKFCNKCGKSLAAEAEIVVQDTANTSGDSIPEYNSGSAIAALIVSIFCCGGIIGIIFAILSLVEGGKVKTFVANGNIDAANASLADAKKWNKYAWIGIAIFMVLGIAYLIFVFGIGMLGTFAEFF